MTDPMNALRQASAEVSGVDVLNDAAVNVWCAFCRIVEDHGPPRLGLAAALRAAADQVVPDAAYSKESPWQVGFADRDAQLRRDILAIAAELEVEQ